MTEIAIGDHVSIPTNAKGTVWESGWVQDINRHGEALIKYGSKGWSRLYEMGGRIHIDKLVKLED